MAGEKEIKPRTASKPKKKRKIFSTIILSFTILLFTLTLLVFFTQTKTFRSFVRGIALDKINEEFSLKESSLFFESLEGNIFSEIIINNAQLKVKKDEMITFRQARITYDIFSLLNKKIYVNEVVLVQPSVNFTTVVNEKGDTVWNYAYLFSSEEEKEKDESEFEWKIIVDRLKIEELNFVMLAKKEFDVPLSSLKIKDESTMNLDNLKISNLSLETFVEYDKNATHLNITQFSFKSNFNFDIKGFTGDFFVTKTRAEIGKMNIETSRSWIQMDQVLIDKLDLLDMNDMNSFKGKEVHFKMTAKNFNVDDLKCFLPAVNFLDGSVYADIKVSGKYDDMLIEKCILKTDGSNLNFTGKMFNLVEPENLAFDVRGENLTLDPSDTKKHLPGLPIPDYSYLGKVTGDLSYKGKPTNFQTTFNISSSAGNAKGSFDLNLTTPNLDYSSYCEASNLNIGKVLRDEKMETQINGRFEVKGSGFSLANINTRVAYEINNTKILGEQIDKSTGKLYLNRYNLEADVTYVSRSLNANVIGNVNIADFKNPKYNLKGSVKGLDVTEFTKDKTDKSNLNFSFNVNGSGYDPNNIQGTFAMDIGNSYYGTFDIPATPLDLKISTTGSSNYLYLTSDIVDFKADGKFRVDQIGSVLLSNIEMILEQAANKFELDTLLQKDFQRKESIVRSDMFVKFEMRTKNPEALNKLLFLNDIQFAGEMNGTISNSSENFKTDNFVRINYFRYKDSIVQLNNSNLRVGFQNDYSAYSIQELDAFNSMSSDLIFDSKFVRFGSNKFDSVRATLKLENQKQFINISGRQDTTFNAFLKGKFDVSKNFAELSIDMLDAVYNTLHVYNNKDVLIRYNTDNNAVEFTDCSIGSNILNADISGKLGLIGESDLNAEIKKVNIAALMTQSFAQNLPEEEIKQLIDESPLRGEIRRVSISYKGTLENPVLGIEMNTGLIRYQTTKVGRVDAFIDYSNNILSSDVLFSNAQGKGSLRLTGNIPFSNPLSTSDNTEILSKPVDLSLRANNFQLNFFSKLIPNFADIRGLLNGELKSSGTLTEPKLSGNMNIDKGRFLLTMNNMHYRFQSSFRAENSDLVVDNFRVYNIDSDDRHIDLYGRINFAGLNINNIDLAMQGDIVFLDRTSPKTEYGFYGDMIVGSGSPPVTIRGNLSALKVEGQLLVKSANLVFPSLQGSAYDIYADNFVYKILTDTVNEKYLDTIITKGKRNEQIDPFLLYQYELTNKIPSIKDNIIFDLYVVTEKNIYVSVNFNSLTREELFGEMRGNLHVETQPNKEMFMFGSLDIVGDSYYRFYKNFKIVNSNLTFNGPMLNPELNIHAAYQNIRTVNDGTSTTTEKMTVLLDIDGTRYLPKLTLKLQNENGAVQTGTQAQSDAISYLIFGVPISSVGASSTLRTDILNNLGNSLSGSFVSSLLSNAIRDVAPFILNTEVIYTGDIKTTDVRVTSQLGDAIVKLGGRVFTDINNAEVSIEYPLNKLLNLNVSNNLILELSRVVIPNPTVITTGTTSIETGVKLTYKIKY